jgi:hypothetical protein
MASAKSAMVGWKKNSASGICCPENSLNFAAITVNISEFTPSEKKFS